MPKGIFERQIIEKKCVCGKEFKAGGYLAKYCKECKLKNKYEWSKAYNRKVRYEKRKARNLRCEECGCDLTDFKKSKRFCPECRLLREERRREDYRQQHRDKARAYNKKYYEDPKHKARHRVIARESLRRKRESVL